MKTKNRKETEKSNSKHKNRERVRIVRLHLTLDPPGICLWYMNLYNAAATRFDYKQ